MQKSAALGFLFVVGVLLIWSACIGQTGALLAVLFCPQQLLLLPRTSTGDLPGPTEIDTSPGGPINTSPGLPPANNGPDIPGPTQTNPSGPTEINPPPPIDPGGSHPTHLSGPPDLHGPVEGGVVTHPPLTHMPSLAHLVSAPRRTAPARAARRAPPAPASAARFSLSRRALHGRF